LRDPDSGVRDREEERDQRHDRGTEDRGWSAVIGSWTSALIPGRSIGTRSTGRSPGDVSPGTAKMAETMARNHRATAAENATATRKLNLTSMTFLPSSVVAAAIKAETTIPSNPSTVMTAESVTTVKPHHHVHNVTEHFIEHDEFDHSE